MKIKTSIVYIYFLVIVQTWFGIKKTTQRNYIERKKKKDPVDRNRATFPCFLPFLFLRVRENVTCAEGSFALLPPPHKVRASSFTLVEVREGSFDFIPRIRLFRIQLDSQWWQRRRETGREREREKDTKNESTAGCSVLARRSCVYACAHTPLDAPMIHRARIHFVLLLESLVPAPSEPPCCIRAPPVFVVAFVGYIPIYCFFSPLFQHRADIERGQGSHGTYLSPPGADLSGVFVPFTEEESSVIHAVRAYWINAFNDWPKTVPNRSFSKKQENR